jgi:HlyD family secretion protein
MDIGKKRRIVVSGTAIVALLAVGWGFMPSPVPVDVAAASRGKLVVTVEEQGKTQVKDRYVISAPVSGFMQRIELKAGDPVEPGSRVAFIEPARSQALDPRSRAEGTAAVDSARSRLSAAQERGRAARADAEYAKKRLDRMRLLYERSSIARDALDQAESDANRAQAILSSADAEVGVAESELERARRILDNYAVASRTALRGDAVPVQSPVGGRVLRIHRESEGSVMVGEPLVDIGSPESLEVRVEVLSSDAVKIRKGTSVVFDRWGGKDPLTGVVRVVEPSGFTKVSSLGVEEQRVVVLVDITTPAQAWKGLGDAYRLDAGFIIWEGRDVLQIPASALFRSGKGWAVFTAENGRAHLKTVTPGHGNGLFTEILSGLSAGEVVITHPDDAISDGIRIKQNT